MQRIDIAEYERRIAAALDRIGKGIEGFGGAAAAPVASRPAGQGGAEARVAALEEALEVEKTANAQLAERLRAVKDRDHGALSQAETRIEALTRQLDVQGLEMQRMRKTTIQLRDSLRAMTEAAATNAAEPHLINKAMLAELEALRALRQTEVAEMDEILTALAPLVEEATTDA